MPRVFTEQDASMLSAVLRSGTAIKIAKAASDVAKIIIRKLSSLLEPY